MTGHIIDGAEVLNSILWGDAELQAINIGYDSVCITIKESTGRKLSLSCNGYIGYEVTGFWDEVVIERVALMPNHEFVKKSLESIERRLGSDTPDSGCESRNQRNWNLFMMSFIDGHDLKVVTAGLSVEILQPA